MASLDITSMGVKSGLLRLSKRMKNGLQPMTCVIRRWRTVKQESPKVFKTNFVLAYTTSTVPGKQISRPTIPADFHWPALAVGD